MRLAINLCILSVIVIIGPIVESITAREDSVLASEATYSQPSVADSLRPVVIDVRNANHPLDSEVLIGDILEVKVQHAASLQQLVARQGRLTLYLDGQPANSFTRDHTVRTDGVFLFELARDTSRGSIWDVYYKFPRNDKRLVAVSIGPERGDPILSHAKLTLVVVRDTEKWIANIILFTLIAGLIIVGRSTSILRDGDHDQSIKGLRTGYYSLSRAQMAFWTVLVVSAYLYIYLYIGELPIIPQSILVLLGMSIGGTIISRVVDNKNDMNTVLTQGRSEGFWNDILSESGGPSIHRLQLVIWTGVMAFVFVRSIIVNLKMPEFSIEQLLLMGISTGAYVTVKGVELKKEGAHTNKPETTPIQPHHDPDNEIEANLALG